MRNDRIADIQFLRAVAILLVLVGHQPALVGWHGVALTEFQSYFALGSGVDLFFAISGFVICRSFINHNGGRIPTDFRSAAIPFWIRRAYRILPAAWFWLAASLVATVFLNPYGNFGKFWPNLWDATTAFFQVANFSQWACASKWISWCAEGNVPNGIYWSLSLEEQFYILFPIALVLAGRWPVIVSLVVLAVSLAYGEIFRFIILLAGVLLGLASFHPLYARLRPSFLERRGLKELVLVVMTLLIVMVPAPAYAIPFCIHLLAVLCAVWVFIASHGLAMPRTPLTPFFMWVGSRSYALYLGHMMAFCATREIFFLNGNPGTGAEADVRYWVLAALLLLAFAEGTYRFLERPFIKKGQERAQSWRRPVAGGGDLRGVSGSLAQKFPR